MDKNHSLKIIKTKIMSPNNRTDQKLSTLNIVVFILTIYVLGALVIDTVFKLQYETE